MRRGIARAILAAALLGGCSPPHNAQSGGQWHKAGADQTTIARDSAECRDAAQDEALHRYPYRASSPTLGATGAVLGQQRDDNARAVAEASMFNSCMQARGYQR